jgi:hypothetical protein
MVKLIPKDACPETNHFVEALVACPQGQDLEDHDDQSQPHRQLRKQVMIGDGQGELNAVPQQVIGHGALLEKQSSLLMEKRGESG